MALEKEHPLDIDEAEHAIALMRNLSTVKEGKRSCNLIIKVGDEEIPADRNVLCASSDYFKAMLSHDTVENQSGIIDMKGVEFKFVKKCVDYIYTGKLSISELETEQLLYVATLMQLSLLCEKIETFLVALLNPTSFYKLLVMASKLNCKKLKAECDMYAQDNLGAIAREDYFGQLDAEYVSSLMEGEKSSYSEDAKLAVLLKWIKADIEHRRQHLATMAGLLNLEKVSPQYNRYLTENEPLCYESAEFLRSLHIAVLNDMKAESVAAKVPFHGKNNALLMFEKTSKTFQTYHPVNKRWSKLYDAHEQMVESKGCTAAVVEKHLYVFMESKKVFKLNFLGRDLEWIQMNDMLKDHGEHLRAAVLGDFVYVAGENSMERFNLEGNKWEDIPSEGMNLNQCALAGHGEDIYSIGGISSGTAIRDVHKFSPSSHSWQPVADMMHPRRLAAAVSHDALYVAGGLHRNRSKRVEFYDERTKCWSVLESLSKERANFSLHVVYGFLFALGGEASVNSAEFFNSKEKQWVAVFQDCDKEVKALSAVPVWLQLPK